ncbi:MAG: hypothetical protein K2Y71_16995 [Xanthobacteraceae bacterium]|nr:hypothetical protein [Xanthobacteraceae bacterium]
MSNQRHKIIQLVPAPAKMSIVRREERDIRFATPVVAFALLDDGSIRGVYVEYLPNENVGRLKIAERDALFYPPEDAA